MDWDQIGLTRRLSKRTFALFLLCGAPSWAVVPAIVVANLGRSPLQHDNAEFLPAVILRVADDGVEPALNACSRLSDSSTP